MKSENDKKINTAATMTHQSQTNGASLEDCHTNFFALVCIHIHPYMNCVYLLLMLCFIVIYVLLQKIMILTLITKETYEMKQILRINLYEWQETYRNAFE